MKILAALALLPLTVHGQALPVNGLLLDLDAGKGVTLEEEGRVSQWENQAAVAGAQVFMKQDKGRAEPGSGRPTLRKAVPELRGHPSLIFLQQELVCPDEDAFDGLSTGKGHTWLAVIAPRDQRVGLADVNAFFGNLRNGGKYEGIWGCLNDDNTLWYGIRNGITFGRFDENNPQLLGPKLETGRFHLVGGRLASGTGEVAMTLYAHNAKPVAEGTAIVDASADPSRMTIGQERDAIEHPGFESFDGEIARFLIWERPLDDAELAAAMEELGKHYLP